MNVSEIYLMVDEIDHVTYAYRKGKGLDIPHSVRLIKQYTSACPEVAELTKGIDPIFKDISGLPAEELVQYLVGIRTILLKQVWPA